jgi:hypothetical protein
MMKFEMIHSYARTGADVKRGRADFHGVGWKSMSGSFAPSTFLLKDALPGKKAATFFQLDERISMMINLEIASQLPLLHGASGQ